MRLDARGAITFRPSISTHEVRRALRSEDFDALAATFDDVIYGGRAARTDDVAAARERWPAVVRPKRSRREAAADPRARGALGLLAFSSCSGSCWPSSTASRPRRKARARRPTRPRPTARRLRRGARPRRPSRRRLRTPIADTAPRPGETLLLLDPTAMEPDEARALGRWVRGGGQLVVGDCRTSWLDEVLGEPPRWELDAAARTRSLVPNRGRRAR